MKICRLSHHVFGSDKESLTQEPLTVETKLFPTTFPIHIYIFFRYGLKSSHHIITATSTFGVKTALCFCIFKSSQC